MHDLTLAPGEEYTVSLEGRGSAGFAWEVHPEGDVDAVEVVPAPPPAPRVRVAALEPPEAFNAQERFVIRACAPGAVTVRMALRRPWERDRPPLEEQTFHVRVTREE